MKRALVFAFAALMALSVGMFAGPDLHLKTIYYDGSSVIAPGVGLYYLGTTPWGFMVEHSFVQLDFESAENGCGQCEIGEKRLEMAGVWDIQVLYDFPVGGCDPGPCDKETIRVGLGLAIPAYLGMSSIHGIQFGADEMGLVAGVGYVFDLFDGKLKDCSVRGEVYWNWNRNDLGSALSFHVDVFSLSDWIRGRDVPADVAIE